MDIKKRINVINYLNEAEIIYDVENWSIHGLDIWPIVKEQMFYLIFRKANWKDYLKLFCNHLYSRRLDLKKDVFSSISETSFLFSAGSTVRLDFQGYSYNKFFDPMMDYIDSKGSDSILVEYHKILSENLYRNERIVDGGTYGLNRYNNSVLVVENDLKTIIQLNEFIQEAVQLFAINSRYFYRKLASSLNNIIGWKGFYKEILTRSKPKMVFLLCYYCEPCFGLIAAAREFNIPTCDMQHGAQGKLHFAYRYESRLSNLNTIPTNFWVWDDVSYNDLVLWFPQTKIFLGGNPWISKSIEGSFELPENGKLILYSLQTTIQPYVPNFLIEAIKQSDEKYLWWFRFHPRMKSEEIGAIYKTLKENNVFERVEIEMATNLPLPVILNQTTVHLSSSSGSLGEAGLLNVPVNITFSELGANTYKELIDRGELTYIPFQNGEEFLNFINSAISEQTKIKNNTNTHFSSILDELI